MIPRATYRLQFHAGFTFADAQEIVPYLHDLGISHVYASPLAEARDGSTHGYDVTDPTRISAALGGEEGLGKLVADLRSRDMGLILDIVPNHMAASVENPWWADMLRLGEVSRFAHFFDIDWSRYDGRVLLPVLGDPLDDVISAGQVKVVEKDGQPVLRLYDQTDYPLAPGTAIGGDLGGILQEQHYLLAWWRLGNDALNWRRFFSISELAGLRIELDDVFDAVHDLPLRLYRQGLIDGLRIDHVDGLADPLAYLEKLRGRLDALDRDRADGPAWLVVENILGRGEQLPATWPVDGTTGYDFMDEVSQLLHAPAAEEPLTRYWAQLSGRPGDFEEEEILARRQMLQWEFSAQFEACVDALYDLAQTVAATAHYSRAAWARASRTVLLLFPVYRTYGTGDDAPRSDGRVHRDVAAKLARHSAPGEAELGEAILDWLAGEGPASEQAVEFVQRFQQLSAPIAAKAVEDTAFYRFGRWIGRNDVGFDATSFAMNGEAFHQAQLRRSQAWPRAMLTTATHDHKRGEDVRARLAAISHAGETWIAASQPWLDCLTGGGRFDRGDAYMLLQAVVGAWPENCGADDSDALAAYARRMEEYAVKSLREAKLRSSWVAPDEDYERVARTMLETLLLAPEAAAMRRGIIDFLAGIAAIERDARLAQVFLRNTCPGIPDLYQGAELAELSLVDPDNRRAVDYALREDELRRDTDEKQRLVRRLLQLRSRHELAFRGAYQPLVPSSNHAGRLIAFVRGEGKHRLVMVSKLPSADSDRAPGLGPADSQGWRTVNLTGDGKLRMDDLVQRSNLLPEGLPCAVWQF